MNSSTQTYFLTSITHGKKDKRGLLKKERGLPFLAAEPPVLTRSCRKAARVSCIKLDKG